MTYSIPDFEFDSGVFIQIDGLSQECGFAQSAPTPLPRSVLVFGYVLTTCMREETHDQ